VFGRWESGGLTGAVRIVSCVTGDVQVCNGGVCDLRYRIAWCPDCRHPVLAGMVADRCRGLIGVRADWHDCHGAGPGRAAVHRRAG
jgi:hypothetical protein